MYKCSECKAVYKDKIDYCDCGNNVFEEISATEQATPSQTKRVENTPKKPEVQPRSILAISFLALCVIFSLSFILFLGPKPKKREHSKKPKVEQKVQQIPSIDKVWDNTPSYTVKATSGDELDLYKNSLRNLLLSQVDTNGLEGSGACEIEFVVDRNGTLKRKKLYQNTGNKKLIDAAKSMLAGVKSYNPPPSNYTGTTLKLEFSAENETYILKYKN